MGSFTGEASAELAGILHDLPQILLRVGDLWYLAEPLRHVLHLPIELTRETRAAPGVPPGGGGPIHREMGPSPQGLPEEVHEQALEGMPEQVPEVHAAAAMLSGKMATTLSRIFLACFCAGVPPTRGWVPQPNIIYNMI